MGMSTALALHTIWQPNVVLAASPKIGPHPDTYEFVVTALREMMV
jgi:hypothetical protein